MAAILMAAQWGRRDEQTEETELGRRRLRRSDQSTPGREPDTTRGAEFRIGGWS